MNNILGLWPNLSRAIEIAKVGGHTISVHFADDYTAGFSDYQTIKNFCKGWFDGFVANGDLKVELVTPYDYQETTRYETMADITERVERAKAFPKPEIVLSAASQSLLKTAIARLDFSLATIEKVKEVAATIAQAELSVEIKVEHLAEAIHYARPIEGGYSAEAGVKVFEAVTVNVGASQEDINAAIEYLNSLKS